MGVLIPITRGLVTLIDDADYELVSRYSWQAQRARQRAERYYVRTHIDGRGTSLHRLLLNPPPHLTVDHANGDGLDNRRGNLRIATRSQNAANRDCKIGTVGFRGVWLNRHGRFRAVISDHVEGGGNKLKFLGTFVTPEEAARVYDRAAAARFGAFARLNFPDAIQHEAAA